MISFNQIEFVEPTEKEIKEEIKRNHIYNENDWWYCRENLRLKFNGSPPNNFKYWDDYWRLK